MAPPGVGIGGAVSNMPRERKRTSEHQLLAGQRFPRADYLEAEFDPEVAKRTADASMRRHVDGIQRKATVAGEPSLTGTLGISTEGKTTKQRAADVDMARRLAPFVQRKATTADDCSTFSHSMQAMAAHGVASPARALPHADRIQASFGPEHDVSRIRAHIDPESTHAMGADAYAAGDDVVFAKEPDVETAAHEAAHVVQQAQGVHLKGGIGEPSDAYEQNADAVAARVKAGESAADLLRTTTTGTPTKHDAIQHKKSKAAPSTSTPASNCVQPRGSTDPLLVSETREVLFPKTIVGSTSIRWITLRNDDTRPIALDGLTPLRPDMFHEVEAALNSTAVLQPGERRDVAIRFRPARATRIEHILQVITGFGPVGPSGDIRVVGEGIDVPYDGERSAEQPASAKSSALATEIRIEQQERDIVDLARADGDKLAKKRAEAVRLVRQWQYGAIKYNHSLAKWTLANWLDFLGKTAGDHELHGTAQVVDLWKKIVNSGIKKGVGEAGKGAIKLAKKSAKVALALEYPLFGFAIAQGIDRLADFIVDKVGLLDKPEDESDKHALDATRRTGRAGAQKTDEILGYESHANLAILDTASAAVLQVARSESSEELEQWQEWAKAEVSAVPPLVDEGGRQFSDLLLKQWVLEHAGTTQQANRSTNPQAWAAARRELKDKRLLYTLERTDLYIHQCRQEWGSLGLVETEQVVAALDAERLRVEATARELQNPHPVVATQVALGEENRKERLATFHRTTNPRRLAAAIGSQQYQLGPDDKDGVRGLDVFGSEFTLDCRVTLGVEGGAVLVRRFWYDVRSKDGRHYTGIIRVPGGS